VIEMALTDRLDAEFAAFCQRDGLSPSGTHYQLWKEARSLGLLPAIWAVLHSEVPSGEKLDDLLSLEPYAQSPLEPEYLAPSEVARELNVSASRVRALMDTRELDFKDTPLGRIVARTELEDYKVRRRGRGRPLKEMDD
jgi:hypothetical protein